MKQFKGKAIYQPAGKAAEYSSWACNFYVGCSNNCTYCYCKKGILAGAMGQDKPQLKKCFKNERNALEIFENELNANIVPLREHGLFFSFTTDPMLPETLKLTIDAAGIATYNEVPVKILTKCVEFADWYVDFAKRDALVRKDLWAFGFTLTGYDELEPGASTNTERIEAMKKLHEAGFKTFASIEPIITFHESLEMIARSMSYCDLFKIGLMSGKKYEKWRIKNFVKDIFDYVKIKESKIYFKDSLLKAAGISRESLHSNCVTRDFKLHLHNSY